MFIIVTWCKQIILQDTLAKQLKGTNMSLEQLLNLIKRASPSPQRKPRAARLVAGGKHQAFEPKPEILRLEP